MTTPWPDVVLALLAGPLVVAGLAKVAARADRLSWPVERGPLRAPVGPRLVGTAEVLAACAVTVVQGRPAAVLAVTVGVVLTTAAAVLRGRECACFGAARLATVKRSHVVGNLLGTAAAVAALVGGPGDDPVLRAAVAGASALVAATVVLVLDRRARRVVTTPRCDEPISAVRLYTTAGCPSCRAVKQLVATVEQARRDAVVTVVLAAGEKPPGELGIAGVPAAIGLGTTGEPVCGPVSGVGAVKALVDSISVVAPERATDRVG
ncbi:hypothetical protein [Actinokineospora diospyrosa]|uniref:Methylamine utilization protein MauE n=1 Tax=Actinokineospora diospyrosa TaxID=103728 RepID=A0ABT1IJ35_9PSEU|nr:hypothetical protein [Actinokineospora diospyrosa]MCP2272670.1 hypothetical protein [Actinokineospora diospyrosa]